MPKLNINFKNITGKIKPMHEVGQPPFAGGSLSFDFSYMEYLREANIQYSRLHDVGGAFGSNRFVDIPNLFRNFDADENDPENYDFAFTDVLLEAMAEYDLKPIFRLGVTIENQAHIRAYNIHPPKDSGKWARICEHVIRHYNEGWANGYTYGIEYWEIWNEPENNVREKNQMWTGTPQQFYELYDVTAKHLKKCFGDKIKVGGYGASGMYGIYYHPDKYGVDVPQREKDERYDGDIHRVEFFLGFLEYIKEHGSPMDFFTWHSYANVEKTLVIDSFIDRKLTEYGHEGIERHMNEWNNSHDISRYGTSYASSYNAAMLCGMHNSHTDMLCYYDARLGAGAYSGFFHPITYKPVCTYYAFKAFGELYALGEQAELTCDKKEVGFYSLAATDGKDRHGVMMVNISEESREIHTDLNGNYKVYLLDADHFLTETDLNPTDFTLGTEQVVLIKNY